MLVQNTVSGRRVEPRSGRSFETSSAVEAERAAIGADQFVICRAAHALNDHCHLPIAICHRQEIHKLGF